MPNLTIFAFLGLLVRGVRTHYLKNWKSLFLAENQKWGVFRTWHCALISAQTLIFQIFAIQTLKSGGRFEPTTSKTENPCFWPKIKSKGCFGLGIAHWFQPKPYFFRFLPFRPWNQGEVRTHHPRDEIPCCRLKIKSKGCFRLGIAHWFQLAYYFLRFLQLSPLNQGGGSNPPPPEMKFRV